MTDFMDLGELHAADIQRLRALINPNELPNKRSESAGEQPPCDLCRLVPCICPEVA